MEVVGSEVMLQKLLDIGTVEEAAAPILFKGEANEVLARSLPMLLTSRTTSKIPIATLAFEVVEKADSSLLQEVWKIVIILLNGIWPKVGREVEGRFQARHFQAADQEIHASHEKVDARIKALSARWSCQSS